jgi:uncharacterized protein (TIGR02118 family)
MYKLSVLYGHPTDPAAFDRYYYEKHIPTASKMKGLSGWTIGKCESTAAGEKPAFYLIVALYGESRQSLEATLASPEGQVAVADLANFATGGATFIFDNEEVILPVSLSR